VAIQGNSGSFSRQDAIEISIAFENCVKTLSLVDRSDPAVLMVANRVIDLATHGQCNAEWLTHQVLQLFKKDTP
jgi:hypothetical protein